MDACTIALSQSTVCISLHACMHTCTYMHACVQVGEFDIENGWGLDERNWAVLTAAENVVETAEQVST